MGCYVFLRKLSPNLDFSDGIDDYYVNHNGSVDNSYVIGRNSCGYFCSPTDPGYTGYVCCINSSGFLGGDAWDYYPHDDSYGIFDCMHSPGNGDMHSFNIFTNGDILEGGYKANIFDSYGNNSTETKTPSTFQHVLGVIYVKREEMTL